MKRILMTLVLVGTAFMAQAAEPTVESIEKLVALTETDKLFDAIRPQINASIKESSQAALEGRTPSAEEKKVIDDYFAKTSAIVNRALSVERLKPIYIALYRKNFSQADINAITAFYQSPAGKSMITKMPQIMQGMMSYTRAELAPDMEQIQAATQQMAKDLKALKK